MKINITLATLCIFTCQLRAQVIFTLSSSPGVGNVPSLVVAADVNGDGKMDLITANEGGTTLSVLTNDGSGGFVLASSPGVGSGPRWVAAADVNGDGKVDLISANYGGGSGRSLSVLTNDGSGGFVLASSPTVTGAPYSVLAVDVNGDGLVDLISANAGGSLTVLTNDGSGGFVLASSPALGGDPRSVTAFTNVDGKVDLVSANQFNNTLSLMTNNGSGFFALAALLKGGNQPLQVAAADVNGDGMVDLISANYGGNNLSVWTNNGSGGFVLSSSPGAGSQPFSVVAADVNGDGKLDLIGANYGDSTLTVLTNDGNGGFVLATNLPVGKNPLALTAADVNGDGMPDLISANSGNNTLSVWINETSVKISPVQTGGTVVGWGACCGYDVGQVTPPAGLSNVVAIAAGSYFNLALVYGGTVVGWGANGSGQINIPAGLSNVVAIAAGEIHSLALTASGTVVGWGDNSEGQTTIPSGLSNVVAIAAFGEQSLALTASGSVVSWGDNSAGQRNIPASLTNAVAIAAGDYFDLALTAGGNVVAWGSDAYGQTNVPAGLGNVVAIAAGSSRGNAQSWGLALTSAGQVVGWGGNSFGQISIPSGLSNVVAIATGWYHSMALKADGTVVAWGAGGADFGQITVPAGLSNVVAIAGGNVHSLALMVGGPSGAVITGQPHGATATVGSTAALTVLASGTPPLSYQWSFDSNNIAGATNATLLIPNVQLTNAGDYRVTISNNYGAVTSSIATLLVVLPPAITTQPQSVTTVAGGPVSFNVTATGDGLLNYQWVGNGSALPGATSDTLTLTNVQPASMGDYYVIVSSQYGSITSSVANLFVYHTAVATPVTFSNFFVGVVIADGGYGYTNAPGIKIIGGGGSGAQAVAVVSNGVVIAINVLNAGLGYTSAPAVIIEPPFIFNPILGIAPMSFLSFTNLTLGGDYQLQRSASWYWTNQPVSFTATSAVYTQLVDGVAGGGDYRLALNPVPAQAFATPVAYFGFIVSATVTSGGSGYVTSPDITIVGGGGTNATGIAQISGGVVTNIVITSAGVGYTGTPTIRIEAPPAAAVSPTVLPVMRVDASQLAPYENYQVQFTPELTATWENWAGGLFSPTDMTNSQFIFITNGVGFFRLQYVP